LSTFTLTVFPRQGTLLLVHDSKETKTSVFQSAITPMWGELQGTQSRLTTECIMSFICLVNCVFMLVCLQQYHEAARLLQERGLRGPGRFKFLVEEGAGHHEGAWRWRLSGALQFSAQGWYS